MGPRGWPFGDSPALNYAPCSGSDAARKSFKIEAVAGLHLMVISEPRSIEPKERFRSARSSPALACRAPILVRKAPIGTTAGSTPQTHRFARPSRRRRVAAAHPLWMS